MVCPIVITNISTPASDVTIDDLAFLTIGAGDSVDVRDLFSLEEISNSTDLQNSILNNEITLTYAGSLITDLGDLCLSSSSSSSSSYVWAAGRKNAIGVAAIDLASLDGAPSSNMPFVSLAPSEIRKVVARSNTNQSWTLLIFKRTSDSSPWVQVKSETINSQTKIIEYSSSPIQLNQGDQIRVRYVRIGDTISNPQVNLLVTQV